MDLTVPRNITFSAPPQLHHPTFPVSLIEKGSCHGGQATLGLAILLPPPPKGWDYIGITFSRDNVR